MPVRLKIEDGHEGFVATTSQRDGMVRSCQCRPISHAQCMSPRDATLPPRAAGGFQDPTPP
jgi:hypothetical protein